MEYLTTKELAEIWNITPRRIQMYCKEGRINGAVLKGNVWLIPKDVEKPQDPRKQNTENQ